MIKIRKGLETFDKKLMNATYYVVCLFKPDTSPLRFESKWRKKFKITSKGFVWE